MGRSEWQRTLRQLTSRDAYQARLFLHRIGPTATDAGNVPEFNLIEEHTLVLLASLTDLPRSRLRDRRLTHNVSRQVNQTVAAIATVVGSGLLSADLRHEVDAANQALADFAPHTSDALTIPWPKEPVDRDSLLQAAADEGFRVRRRLLGASLIYWIGSVLTAIWLNGTLYTFTHITSRSVTGFITYWQKTAVALTALRAQILPLAALAAALLALPLLNTVAPLGESAERRGRQLLLQLVARSTLGALAIISLLATPLRKTAQGGALTAPAGDWILSTAVSAFACLMACVLQVPPEERLRIRAQAKQRLQLINTELERLEKIEETSTTPTPRRFRPTWLERRLFTWDWRAVVPLVCATIPGGVIAIAHHHRGLWRALLWFPLSFAVAWFVLEFLTRTVIQDRWEKPLRLKKRMWLRSQSPLGLIVALCMSTTLALPVALYHSLLLWGASIAWCFVPIATYAWARSGEDSKRQRQRRIEYLRHDKQLCRKTIDSQDRDLAATA